METFCIGKSWPAVAGVGCNSPTCTRHACRYEETARRAVATAAAFSAGAKCLILVVEVPSVLAVCLLILIAVLAAPGAMILFPFHFPFAVLEFRYGNPGLVRARSWRRIREICIG